MHEADGPWSIGPLVHGPSSRSSKLDATPEAGAVQGAAGGVALALTYAKSPSRRPQPIPQPHSPKHHFPLYYLFA